jgi:Ca-activated chloride channel family protein
MAMDMGYLRLHRVTSVILFVMMMAALGAQPGAQAGTSGRIEGRVVDEAGAGLPGVRVVLFTDANKRIQDVVSDARGVFAFVDVAPGKYLITVTMPGFAAETRSITVADGRTATIAVTLRIIGVSEMVTVETSSSKGRRGGRPAPEPDRVGTYRRNFNREQYAAIEKNDFRSARKFPLSTFSVDVDTASYANARRFVMEGQMPPPESVRLEELINYFEYDYPDPNDDAPFSITTRVTSCPWNAKHKLALIGLQAKRQDDAAAPPRNLVFLIDVSGSMDEPNKLPLVRTALQLLVDRLRPQDRVAIVVYAGASGLALPSTTGDRKEHIREVLASLEPQGSTNGAAGIVLAYRIAQENFIKDGINRVILATDGDFNVGVTSQGALQQLIEQKRETGIFLSVLGVGEGNLQDATMELLADKGNGNYNYLDSLQEAHKVLVQQAGSTLITVAKDVKLQVEFNPATTEAYRLIGYENRLLKDEDFNNDRKDAGDMGAGHSVTALYEIVPKGQTMDTSTVDPLKYQRGGTTLTSAATAGELATVKVRYKEPAGETSRLLSVVIANKEEPLSATTGFAAAVAELGLLLQDSKYKGKADYGQVLELARQHRGTDAHGYRAEFVRLVELTKTIASKPRRESTDSAARQ